MERFEEPRWRLLAHLVWSTRGRVPLVDAPRAAAVEAAIRVACAEQGAAVEAVCAMPDHVHVVASIPPALAIDQLVLRLKHASRDCLERGVNVDDPSLFAWGVEYGALTVDEADLPDVVAYVEGQPERHAAGQLWATFELTEPPVGRFGDGAAPGSG